MRCLQQVAFPRSTSSFFNSQNKYRRGKQTEEKPPVVLRGSLSIITDSFGLNGENNRHGLVPKFILLAIYTPNRVNKEIALWCQETKTTAHRDKEHAGVC